jgi:hypothetical protein
MTPVQAIIRRDAPEDEPLFNTFEATCVIKRLASAGYAIVPQEPTREMLEAASRTDTFALINGLIALGLKHAGENGSTLAQAYRAMIERSQS